MSPAQYGSVGGSIVPYTERPWVQFPVRAHTQVVGSVPSWGTCEWQPIDASLSHQCFSPFSGPCLNAPKKQLNIFEIISHPRFQPLLCFSKDSLMPKAFPLIRKKDLSPAIPLWFQQIPDSSKFLGLAACNIVMMKTKQSSLRTRGKARSAIHFCNSYKGAQRGKREN